MEYKFDLGWVISPTLSISIGNIVHIDNIWAIAAPGLSSLIALAAIYFLKLLGNEPQIWKIYVKSKYWVNLGNQPPVSPKFILF